MAPPHEGIQCDSHVGPPLARNAVTRARSFLVDLLLGLVFASCLLALVEGALRLAGVPDADYSRDPYVDLARSEPLFRVEDGIAETAPEKVGIFNDVTFSVPKKPGTFRIFCFGGSTTHGRPYDWRASFSRWLEDLLNASDPSTSYEVINAGGISYASYRIVPIVREVLPYQPDLVVVYTGHNEFLERRTYGAFFDRGPFFYKALGVLRNLKIFQVLEKLLHPLVRSGNDAPADADAPDEDGNAQSGKAANWTGGSDAKTLMPHEVDTIMDRSVGPVEYHRDEAWSKGVLLHFFHNLKAMIGLCRDAGVPIIFVEPPSNIEGFSPFKSEHGEAVDGDTATKLAKKLQDARMLLESGAFQQSLDVLTEFLKIDPLYAEAHFWKGKALLGLQRRQEARDAFVKALDLDVCPVRATSAIRECIRRAVSQQADIGFIPFWDIMIHLAAQRGDKSGIPGNELFIDHVHPRVEMHQLLAELLIEEMERIGLIRPKKRLDEGERRAVYAKGEADFDAEYLAQRDMNLASVLDWAGKTREARAILERSASKLESYPWSHVLLARYASQEGRREEATNHFRRALQLSMKQALENNDDDLEQAVVVAAAWLHWGGASDEAALLEELAATKEMFPAIHVELIGALLEDDEISRALRVAEAGLSRDPTSVDLLVWHARALARSGKMEKAISRIHDAVKLAPNDPLIYYDMACIMGENGRPEEALGYLAKAARKGFGDVDDLDGDPAFDDLRGQSEFKKIRDKIVRMGRRQESP